MRITFTLVVWLVALPALLPAATTEVAELTFDSRCLASTSASNGLPRWIRGLEQAGGQFDDEQKCWIVGSDLPPAQGRLSILIDRDLMKEDLALGLVFDADEKSDFVVQLFDSQDRVIILDLFGNLVVTSPEARTDTFIVPLVRFPTATKITIRRIKGEVKVYGAALYPVVTMAVADAETAKELAKLLGDPLSPENPMFRAINNLYQSGRFHVPNSPTTNITSANSAANQRLGDGWMVLPFYKDSDWPASQGEPGIVGKNEILLRGRPVRSLATYALPAAIECDVMLEQRAASDGSLDFFVIPAGLPTDQYPNPMTNLRVIYSNTGDYGSVDRLDLNQTGGKADPLVWSQPSKFEDGKTYHIQLKLEANGTVRLAINGQVQATPENLRIDYRRFQIQFGGWQPTNRWHVRNVIVH